MVYIYIYIILYIDHNELADIDGLFKCNNCIQDENNVNMIRPMIELICDICKEPIEEEINTVRCEGRKQLNSLVQYICGKYMHKRCWEDHINCNILDNVIVFCMECELKYKSFIYQPSNNINEPPPPPPPLQSSSSTIINNDTEPPPPLPTTESNQIKVDNVDEIVNVDMVFREVAKQLYLRDKEAALEFVKSHLLGNVMNNLIEKGRCMVSKSDINKAFNDLLKKQNLPVKDVTVVKHHNNFDEHKDEEEKKDDEEEKKDDDKEENDNKE